MTEANQRLNINTEPDPYMQTTPQDIGSSLQMLVECLMRAAPMVRSTAIRSRLKNAAGTQVHVVQ